IMAKENQSIVTEFILQGLSSQPRTQTVLFIVFLLFYLLTIVGNVMVIAVIRADCQLQSPMYLSLKACIHMVMASWASSLLSSMVVNSLTLHLPFCGPHTLNHYFCKVPAVLSLACADTALLEFVIFSILIACIPFLLIIISYASILSTILKMQSAHVKSKAFSTCGCHLIVVTIFYGTAICMYMNPKSRSPQDRGKVVAVFYTIVTPMLNPLIYSLRNKDMKRALRRWEMAIAS
uniref:G-protein coupled receptors family 1 profile domain-containing protein n=1 Tax=Amazona collaria TaxID=241587 RepID=A0A8B9G289_9PSIT